MRFACVRRNGSHLAVRRDAQPAGPAQRAECAGGHCRGHGSRRWPTRRSSGRWPNSRASAGASSATARLPLPTGGSFHPDRRLRPSPGGNGGDAGGGARRLSRPAHRAGLPAAPLHPHPRLLRGLRQGAVRRRWPAAGRGLCRRRSADRRGRRPHAGARHPRCRQGGAGVRRGHCRHAGRDHRGGAGRRRGHHHGRRFRSAPCRGKWPMAEALRGELKENEPMAGHVSWRAGGAVARAYFPADLADLAEFLRCLRLDEPLHVRRSGQQSAGARRRLRRHGGVHPRCAQCPASGGRRHRCMPRPAWPAPRWRALPPI